MASHEQRGGAANEPSRTNESRVFETKGGRVTYRTMSLKDLMQVSVQPRPRQPWSEQETYRRWEESQKTGHLQLAVKCRSCSLEFVLLTLRSEIEAMEAYEPSHGEHGGLCRKLTCPECGTAGSVGLLGYARQDGTICEFIGRRLRGTGG